ncbi:MAG: hypothetical protein PT954_00665 [Eubacteriales bacterium]|nr:hypothetical protein [Eubacteriales bacterium]
MTEFDIRRRALFVERSLLGSAAAFPAAVSLLEYAALCVPVSHGARTVSSWSDALEAALREHDHILIPASAEPYFFHRTVVIPSCRYLECAPDATLALTYPAETVLFRNAHIVDGTHIPEDAQEIPRDHDIYLTGGRFVDPHLSRAGYGSSGMLDPADYAAHFHGVSTMLFFNHTDRLYISGTTFVHCAAFAVQCGDIVDAAFCAISFEDCFADGLHIGGNCRNLCIRDIRGTVGDDLVALNLYDWQDSSVNFGPMDSVWCENLRQSPESPYKAMRIEPGIYRYDDGGTVDCALTNAVIENVRGVRTYKLYFQTPRYYVHREEPESGTPGSGDWLYFRDIDVDLAAPIDRLPDYESSDPVTGTIAAFEIGANIGHLRLSDIRLTLHRDRYPQSYLLAIGPKSVRIDRGTPDECEIFDPQITCTIRELTLQNIEINGERLPLSAIADYIREIRFDNIYNDQTATGHGKIESVTE